ncbi:MAG: HAD-IIB family hydrolase [Clostridiales bacterium]|nr:HAD-IIB family hydrolase [Clostridiales bacterium]
MKFDLIVSDFDRTLGVVPNIIDPSVVDAIKKFLAKGGKFAIATGRMMCSAKIVCDMYDLKCLVAAYQGAMIKDMATGEVIFNDGIDNATATAVAKKFVEDGALVCADVDDVLYYDEGNVYVDIYEKDLKIKGVKVDDMVEFLRTTKGTISKLGGVTTDPEVERIMKEYPNVFGEDLIFNSGVNNFVEVIKSTSSKGNAVRAIAEYYNIPLERVMAVGDSTNDILLVDGEWYGVAVGSGREELKAVADEVTVPFEKHPIKVLIEKYCL